MCKILGIIDVENPAKAWRGIEKAVQPMTSRDRDGFGVATIDLGGKMGTAKWLDIGDALNFNPPPIASEITSAFGDIVHAPGGYMATGRISENPAAIIAHSRFATCAKTIENTHPFHDKDEGLVLIHNGVIANHTDLEKKLSTCDSEYILRAYLHEGMPERPGGVQNFVNRLSGSYACIVLGSPGYVDIFRNEGSDLHVAKVDGVGFVFATTPEIIVSTAGKRKPTTYEVKANVFLRYDLTKHKAIFSHEFTPPPEKLVTVFDMPPVGISKYDGGRGHYTRRAWEEWDK